MLARLFACTALCLSSAALAAPQFSVTFLPDTTFLSAINQSGQFVGETSFPPGDIHAALWAGAGAAPRDLGTLGSYSAAQAISSNGLVTGYSYLGNGATHAFLVQDGAMRDLGALAGGDSFGWSVNASGQVAGHAVDAAGEDRPVLYRDGALHDLGTLGGSYGQAHGINDAGAVVGGAATGAGSGAHAFLYQNGAMRDLGTLGGPASYAYAINALGQITGSSFIDDNVQHAFLYSAGAMRDIGSLGGPDTLGRAVNNLGMVVGYATGAGHVPGASFSHAFLYRDGNMLDLNTLVVLDPDWVLVDALGIDDAQQIVAYACNPLVGCRAALMAPVPEPSALALLLAGLLLAGAGRLTVPRALPFT